MRKGRRRRVDSDDEPYDHKRNQIACTVNAVTKEVIALIAKQMDVTVSEVAGSVLDKAVVQVLEQRAKEKRKWTER